MDQHYISRNRANGPRMQGEKGYFRELFARNYESAHCECRLHEL